MSSRALFSCPRLPRFFGRGRRYILAAPASAIGTLRDDAKLFATTFVGGLLFMTIYLG